MRKRLDLMAVVDGRDELLEVNSNLFLRQTLLNLVDLVSNCSSCKVVHHEVDFVLQWVVDDLVEFDNVGVYKRLEYVHLAYRALDGTIPSNRLQLIPLDHFHCVLLLVFIALTEVDSAEGATTKDLYQPILVDNLTPVAFL